MFASISTICIVSISLEIIQSGYYLEKGTWTRKSNSNLHTFNRRIVQTIGYIKRSDSAFYSNSEEGRSNYIPKEKYIKCICISRIILFLSL